MDIKIRIPYKELRKASPEMARKTVLDFMNLNSLSISEVAGVFGVGRSVIYDILDRAKKDILEDKPKTPKRIANKTPLKLEAKIIAIATELKAGPLRLQKYLQSEYKIAIPFGTLRHILSRHKL